jgi:hypothetical protein
MKVEKREIPAVTEVVIKVPAKTEYHLVCNELEMDILNACVGGVSYHSDNREIRSAVSGIFEATGGLPRTNLRRIRVDGVLKEIK